MIKKFIDELIARTSGARDRKRRFGKRAEVGVAVHGIDPGAVDERAQNVVRTLKNAGHEAYIVGGAVRDLMVGLKPKDFDVATSATPEQVKALFRRAFIIGRRFRIVHVVHGRGREHEVIEVSTFRAYMDNQAAAGTAVAGNEKTSRHELAGMQHAVDAAGRVLRDNVWGPQEEDAARRDFTINAMYYDPEAQVVVDYHGGIEDTKKRTLRMIGDATARYREDPVRIIRAVRFAAKLAPLGFALDKKTEAPLLASQKLLAEVPQSRLFDEMLKLLQTGHAVATIAQLNRLGLARGIYPLLDVVVERATQPFVAAALADTDRRVAEGKPVAPSFLLACVLWDDVRAGWQRRLGERQHPFPALQEAIDTVFDERIGDVSGRGRLAADMREIWMMQPRFEKRTGNAPFSLVEQPRFRAGFDFMRLRAEVGEIDVLLSDWWQEFSSSADDAARQELVEQARTGSPRQQRAPRTRRASAQRGADAGDESGQSREASAEAAADGGDPHPDAVATTAAPGAPKKRRRRRRTSASKDVAPPADETGA